MLSHPLRYRTQNAIEKLVTLTIGRLLVSDRCRQLTKAIRAPAGGYTGSARAAILAHVYYPELLPEVLACRQWLPKGTPLHLTVPIAKAAELRALTTELSDLVIHECENRGRDIAPFLEVLGSGVLDACDAVLTLHTKRSRICATAIFEGGCSS